MLSGGRVDDTRCAPGGVAAWYRRVVHRLITSSSSQTATAEVRRRGGDRRRHEQRRDTVRSTVAVSGFGHSSARRNCDTKQIDAALILIIIIIIIPMTKFIVLSSKQTKTHTIKHETILKRTKSTRNWTIKTPFRSTLQTTGMNGFNLYYPRSSFSQATIIILSEHNRLDHIRRWCGSIGIFKKKIKILKYWHAPEAERWVTGTNMFHMWNSMIARMHDDVTMLQ